MMPLRLALVGENIGYSRSPQVFAAMLRQAGVEGECEVHSVPVDQLGRHVQRLAQERYAGFGVTIPHKQRIIEYLDSVDESARVIGAVNSVGIREGSMKGYNTDCDGFTYSLRRSGFAGCERALILGCGGAARAVAFALSHDFGVSRFVVLGRRPDRLVVFKHYLHQFQQPIEIITIISPSELCGQSLNCDLVVNCTPVGGPNYCGESTVPEGFDWTSVRLYFDLNYNHGSGMFDRVRQLGVPVIDGSVMLTAQAIRSLELWTGIKVDFEPVFAEVFSHITG
jgi:shikimate dehydrogenase